ncbi:MAG TPA: M28 family peptidase [Thermoanaerobaculia bacterium]|nr:M28 family peptidase [Thermoanaerobaculia bacterium]
MGAVLALISVLYKGPAAKAPDAPAGDFSAGRARALLGELLGGGEPHPVGTQAHGRTRERVVAILRRLGYSPQVEEGFACNERNVCAAVQNVVALLPGRDTSRAVLLAAHYDSVGAGPGAADDLAGVAAVLEIARLLKLEPAPRHSIVLLLSDGEEPGLLGSRLFMAEHPLARRVGAAVNLEARGTQGPSLMFETGPGNAWLLPLLARVARPMTSSVFTTIYRRLPNDTDFTVFVRSGVRGFNFAFIGGAARYHTSADELRNLSPASLQHQGDNARATVTALAGADLGARRRGDAVFFDVLSLGLVWWPLGWSLPLACAGLLLVLVSAVQLARYRLLSPGSLGGGVLIWLAILAGCVLAPFLLALLLGAAGAFRAPWVAHPLAAQAAFWLAALAVVAAVAATLGRRASPPGLWAGAWIGWSLASIVLAALAPALCYLFVVPGLVAGATGAILASRRAWGRFHWATILPVLAAALVWFPLLGFVYDGIGVAVLPAVGVLLGLVLAGLAPLVAAASRLWRRLLAPAAGALALVLAGLAALGQPFSPRSPQRLTIDLFEDADGGASRWLVESPLPPPPAVRHAAAFEAGRVAGFPWSERADVFAAPADVAALPAPELTILGSTAAAGRKRVRIRLSSPRGAPFMVLYLPSSARVETVRVAGRLVPPRQDGAPPTSWIPYFVLGVPAAGVELEVVLGTTAPQTAYLADRSPGLPPAASALVAARGNRAVPFQNGDLTIVSRRVSI